ncbi:MAG: SusC/RagA family TonB-linked outer membrane protein [Reichenbachiella sp.]
MNIKKYISTLLSMTLLATVGFAQDNVEEVVLDSLSENQEMVKEVYLPFATINNDRVVGATALITQEQMTTADLDLESALIGKAAGLNVNKWSAGPGIDNSSLNIRGINSFSGNTPLIVVDGIGGRTLESLNFYEIESITVLKDITAKILYGAQAANGVVLVKTKRGQVGKTEASINAEYGFRKPTHLPEFLNSGEYARLYNEASINDGLNARYTDAEIAGFEQGSQNDLEFPNVDYHDRYVNPLTNFTRVYGTYSNGDEKTSLYFSAGYNGENGLESVGQQSKYNGVNLRGNLDYKLNKVISVQMDIAARMESTESHRMGYGGFFSTLSTHRPNDYPIFHDTGDAENGPKLGWSPSRGTNIEGELTRAGYVNGLLRQSQSNIGLKLDFGQWVDGLSFNNYVTFDTYNYVLSGQINQYARYQADGTKVGADVEADGIDRLDDGFYRNYGWISSLDYDKSFGDHALTTNLVFMAQGREFRGTTQDNKNLNLALRVNYAFQNKYVVEADVSYMGSNKLEEMDDEFGSRFGLFPAFGLGWVVSNEGFLSSSDVVNYLKVKASYGIMGYDGSFGHFAYNDAYAYTGGVRFGPTNNSVKSTLDLTRSGNPNIGFEKSTEYNIGVEATLFKKLTLDANAFYVYRSDIPMYLGSQYPDYFGDAIPLVNYGEMSNKGIELVLNYGSNVGDLSYNIGGYLTYSMATYERVGDIRAHEHLQLDGTPVDGIWGYDSQGFYTDAADIDVQTSLGGELIPGDLEYADITGDGIITGEDLSRIGNGTPRYIYGLNFSLGYKGIRLSVVGQGEGDVDRMTNFTGNVGQAENKYAANAMNRWTSSNTDASHPRLTTNSAAHSYRGSTFWMEDASYFTIRNVELSYTFPESIAGAIKASNLRVFARGTDLLTISNSDFNADNATAGVWSGPLMRTVSLGVNLSY